MTDASPDETAITKVLTFKSGKVPLSCNRDWDKAVDLLSVLEGAY